jgi:hypothetical protein
VSHEVVGRSPLSHAWRSASKSWKFRNEIQVALAIQTTMFRAMDMELLLSLQTYRAPSPSSDGMETGERLALHRRHLRSPPSFRSRVAAFSAIRVLHAGRILACSS